MLLIAYLFSRYKKFWQSLSKLSYSRQFLLKLIIIITVVHLVFFPNIRIVKAETLYLGSEVILCTAAISQPAYTSETNPTVTVYWDFSSSSSDYADCDGAHTLWSDGTEAGNDDCPALSASTQVSYWVEIDDNSDYSSPVIQTGEVSSSNEYYTYSGASLSFGTTYYWRVIIKDNYGTITDWATGEGGFIPNKPSIKLKGSIKLK